MNIDTMPDYLKEKWFKAAREHMTEPLTELRDYQLEALDWYWDKMREGWEIESPQSYEEALLWHKHDHAQAQVKLERARRNAARAERWLKGWRAKRRSKAGESAMMYIPASLSDGGRLYTFQFWFICLLYGMVAETENLMECYQGD